MPTWNASTDGTEPASSASAKVSVSVFPFTVAPVGLAAGTIWLVTAWSVKFATSTPARDLSVRASTAPSCQTKLAFHKS